MSEREVAVNWWSLVFSTVVAALFEFYVPVVIFMLVLYVLLLAGQGLARRRRFRRQRRVVAEAVEEAGAREAALRRAVADLPGETTVRIYPAVMIPGQRGPRP